MSQQTLPNLIVIGAMKCGTSALHYYLDLHPEVQMSSPKELTFFCESPDLNGTVSIPDETDRAVVEVRPGEWERGLEWYAGHFDPGVAVRGEASPQYTAPWHPSAAQRIAEVLPDARLIYMVRDPVEMVVSQWMHYRAMGIERRSLAEAVSDPHGPYVERARYHACLAPYLERFPSERILVLSQEELLKRRRDVLGQVFGFLGVDEGFFSERMERLRHRTGAKTRRTSVLRWLQGSPLARLGYRLPQEVKWAIERAFYARRSNEAQRPELPAAARERLVAELRPEMERLREATGTELRGWSA